MSEVKYVEVTFNQDFVATHPFVSHSNRVSIPDPVHPQRTKIVFEAITLDCGPEWTEACALGKSHKFPEGKKISVCAELAKLLEKAGVVGEKKAPQKVTFTGEPGREVIREPL